MIPPPLAALSSHWREFLPVLPPLLTGAAAVYFVLPRPQGRQVLLGALLGILALVTGGMLVVHVDGISVETILFYIFSGLAVVSGVLLVGQVNPARAALSFTLVILSVCGLFLLLAAPFLMAATIIIYAGAIVVTFLFVIMLAQQTGQSDADQRSREPLLASATGFVLLGALLFVLRIGLLDPANEVTRDINPFLQRIRAAQSKDETPAIQTALDENPEELIAVLDRLWTQKNPPERAVKDEWAKAHEAYLESARADGFFEKFKKYVELSSGKEELPPQLDQVKFIRSKVFASSKVEPIKEELQKVALVANELRQRAGLSQPNEKYADASSNLSGPASARTAELRRDEEGRPLVPAENSAHLGKSLFTDYLVPVELGGFLLLIATIGAIAIANRHNTPGEGSLTPLLYHYLAIGAVLFVLGMIGFLARRNLIVMFLSAEMMLQGVALNLVAFARYRGNLQGQAFVLFILTVAACEAAVALALILMLYNRKQTLDISAWQELREADQEATVDEEALPVKEKEVPLPQLKPAGAEPEPRQERETSHV